ncbi:hypothetical protein [Burkholderia anthina]|uniref:hypothetical protein n=1 Tax=Burkholderia anthina TaxID=179879 RepID=UPI001FC7CD8D|nr:hypothetical protein [Burkholderia anthina]
MTAGLRMSPEAYQEFLRKRGEVAKPAAQPRAKAPPTSRKLPPKARLQALGRLRDGEMNKSEAAYAAVLEERKRTGDVLWYRFEGIKFKLAPKTFLTVDFAVMLADHALVMVDVKGAKAIVEDDARVKMKVAADLFPFRFMLAYPRRAKNGGGFIEEDVL